ncbi:hypothetical protein ACLM5J_15180 [Nocardioides sp. Bht2]|uniref:hypothetical protein n=1 Tax=Nocardioides sp. Bht2 TaxID=3392297 RepID=UPI0039B559A2
MSTPSPIPRLIRRGAVALVILAVVLIIAFSNSFGRAEPTGNYRPPLPPVTLDTGCYPLPDGVHFDFSYQTRRDGDVETDRGIRRVLRIQWNLVDVEQARRNVLAAFTDAGFTVVSDEPRSATVTRADVGEVSWRLSPLDVSPDTIVQGWVVFDLPAIARQSDAEECGWPSVTKRFGKDLL